MEVQQFQILMQDQFGETDRARGVPATIAWLTEELGELAQAVRKGTLDQQIHEIGDVFAWLASLANQLGIDLEEAIARFADGCPKCSETPCVCH
jgi:NTP pyrophosphatase (non-canonical NTP hydrolase)